MASKWLVPLMLLLCSTAAAAAAAGDVEDASGSSCEAYTHGSFGTTLHGSYNFLKCTTDLHVTPTSTEELVDLLKQLTSSGKPVKIRATRVGFHSGAGFVCAGHRDSIKKKWANSEHPPTGFQSVTVLLNRLNRVVAVDQDRLQITIEAGATVIDLANAAEANGMSIRAGAYSVYSNLTLGGVLSASAHGSGLGTISSLGMLVRKLKWVNAKGEVHTSDGEEMNALLGGLGLLGIITEITFQLEGKSLTIIEAREDLSDDNIAGDLIRMVKEETPHVITYWRPDLGTFKVQLFHHVPGGESNLPADAPPFQATTRSSILMAVNDQVAGVLGGLLNAWDDDIADDSPIADALNNGVCSAEDKTARTPLFTDENGTKITRATARTNYVMTGPECTPNCIWEVHHMKAMAEDMEFTIKLSQLHDWVDDVKSIIHKELAEVQHRLDTRYGKGKVKRCLPPGSLWIRFGKGTNGVLATSGGTEDVAFVQWGSLISASATSPGKHAAIIQAIEQLSLCKYKARPHWGKNHERVFRHHECHVRDNYPEEKFDKILELQARHDPEKVFEPELFTHVLRKDGPEYSHQCALHMWCYCREDAHCPVGFACLPSPAFPEHKVCRVIVAGKHDEL